MRDYKAKMDRYRLPKQRRKELREFCMQAESGSRDVIEMALMMTTTDLLGDWLYKHVTSEEYGWARMEADGLPCGRDTFRVARAKFYWMLDNVLKGANNSM